MPFGIDYSDFGVPGYMNANQFYLSIATVRTLYLNQFATFDVYDMPLDGGSMAGLTDQAEHPECRDQHNLVKVGMSHGIDSI